MFCIPRRVLIRRLAHHWRFNEGDQYTVLWNLVEGMNAHSDNPITQQEVEDHAKEFFGTAQRLTVPGN